MKNKLKNVIQIAAAVAIISSICIGTASGVVWMFANAAVLDKGIGQ